ncbi:MAG: RnfH family protein [Cocleimonas sp.]
MKGANPAKITVEIVYALPEEQTLLAFEVDESATAEDVINQSGILQQYPEIDLNENKVGLFGKLIKLDHPIREKDRIEIYRPLIADPKEVRKKRAAEGKALKKGGSVATED